MRAAVFLDRDGVINENRSAYIRDWSDVEFLPGVFEALRRLAESDLSIVLVTNQSAVGRGIISHERALDVNRRIVAAVRAEGARIEGTYLCPHHPDDGCACRKPRPGLLLQAAADLGLDLAASYLIGDALSDVRAARAAGVRGLLVLTGRGRDELARMSAADRETWPAVTDLKAAVDVILHDLVTSAE